MKILEEIPSSTIQVEETLSQLIETKIKKLDAFHRLSSEETIVKLICGPQKTIYAKEHALISTGAFFELMLSIRTGQKSIDMTTFCTDELTLVTLILFASLKNVVEFEWTTKTVANMLFIIKPLRFKEITMQSLFSNIYRIMDNTDSMIAFCNEFQNILFSRSTHQSGIIEIASFLTKPNGSEGYQLKLRYRMAIIVMASWMRFSYEQQKHTEYLKLCDRINFQLLLLPDSFVNSTDENVISLIKFVKIICVV